ncbi:MAG: ATP-binding protein [Bacteroidota bacterium]
MRLHPLTLQFTDAATERAFWTGYTTRMGRQVRWLLLLGVGMLVPYGLVDARVAPEYVGTLWGLRIGTAVTLVGIVSVLFARRAQRLFTPVVALASLVTGLGLVAVGWYWGLAGTLSTHPGIIVLLFFVHVLIRMRFVHAALVGAVISAAYLAQLSMHPVATGLDVLEQGAALLVANVVGMAASYTLERYARRVYWQTRRLEARGEELHVANTELTNALDHLQSTQAQLVQSEKMASLGQLTAGIAHEIKNPLNFVTNFAGLSQELVAELEAESDPDERSALLADLKACAAKIDKHGRRVDAIVRRMMELARGGEGTRAAVALNPLVREYAEIAYHSMRAQHPDFDVTLDWSFAEEAGDVLVAHRELGSVLANLLDNAFDATRERATSADASYIPAVSVSTVRAGKHVEIRIEDNGSGIPESVQANIFEPFFTTKPTGEGTGLGLSLAHDIVVQGYGGTLTVESISGEGTCFVITLPSHATESSAA